MDKPALLGVARRRWYILVLGFLASLCLGYGATLANPPHYTARALVMLLPPVTTVEEVGNPFLVLGNLDLPARVVVATVSSASVREDVVERHPEIDYAVTMEESTRGPVIAIDVTGTSEGQALEALPTIVQQTISTLQRLQNEVDAAPDASVRAMLLTQDDSATVERGGTVRIGIAVVALGFVGTVLGASAVDGRIRARRSRSTAHDEGTEPPPLDPTPSAPPAPETATPYEDDQVGGTDSIIEGADEPPRPAASEHVELASRAESSEQTSRASQGTARGRRNNRTRSKASPPRKSR
jgi:hypothetical protein